MKRISFLLLTVLLALGCAIPAMAADLYTDAQFASALTQSDAEAMWGFVASSAPTADGDASVTIRIQAKDYVSGSENQPSSLLFFILANNQTTVTSVSGGVYSANETTKEGTGSNLASLQVNVANSNLEVKPESDYYYLYGTTASTELYATQITAFLIGSNLDKGYSYWDITLNYSGIDADTFNTLRFGIPMAAVEDVAEGLVTYAFTSDTKSAEGYQFNRANRWILPGTGTIAQTYIVNFNTNGGTPINAKTVDRGSSTVLPAPYKDGYTFAGWYADEALTTKVESPYTPTADVTLYAKWDVEVVEQYTITFNTNGGNAIDPMKVDKNKEAELPTPVRAGYTFEGWYMGSDYKEKAPTPFVAQSDITLYAKWRQATGNSEMYTISFETNGGYALNSVQVEKGGMTFLPTPIKNGYAFKGWYTSAELKEKVSDIYYPTASVMLYASWTKIGEAGSATTYSISFNSNGGSAVETIAVVKGQPASLPIPTRDGYTFNGWFTESALNNKVASPYTATKDITLYAGWTAAAADAAPVETTPANENWTIVLNSNGGSAVGNIDVAKGSSVSLPSPTMSGYNFVGWFTEPEMRNMVSSPYTPSANVTLYAAWTKAESTTNVETAAPATNYMVTFNTNGGSAVEPASVIAGNAVNLVHPSKSGYTFAGWYTDAGLTTKVNSSTFVPSSDTTLYAKWTAAANDESVPKTGHESNVPMILIIMAVLVCAAGVIIAVRYRMISKNNKVSKTK